MLHKLYLYKPDDLLTDTTRPLRSGEVAGREYLFVSREKMEADIAASKFIEHGEFRGQLYGTSADSVKSIISAGAVCIMNPHFQAIKALRTPQLVSPFMFFIEAYESISFSFCSTETIHNSC